MIRRNKLVDKKSRYIVYWIITALFVVYCATIIYPFVWTFFASMMEPREYFENYTHFLTLPKTFNFENYRTILGYKLSTGGLKEWTMWEMAGNTLWLAFSLGIMGLILPCCCAYCCAKYKFFGSNFFFYYGIVFCAIPLMGGQSTTFRIIHFLNLYDNLLVRYYLTITGSTYASFLFLYAFFKGLSWTLAESAFIDGATDFQVFIHIMLPQVLHILITFFIGNFIASWNDWQSSYLYTPSTPMVAYGVQRIVKLSGYGDPRLTVPMSFAALFLMMIPPFVIFTIFHKRILNTIYTGGLKG